MTQKDAELMCAQLAAKLGEHFDAVQVMATWNEDGQSTCVQRGTGNWYARQGMAHEFIEGDTARTNAAEIAQAFHHEDD